MKDTKRKHKLKGKKRRNKENGETELVNQLILEGKGSDTNDEKKKGKVARNKKRKSEKLVEAKISETDEFCTEPEHDFEEKNSSGKKDKKESKLKKKKRNKEKIKEAGVHELVQLSDEGTRNKKRKSEKVVEAGISGTDEFCTEPEYDREGKNSSGKKDNKKSKLKKKKRNKEKIKEAGVNELVQLSNEGHLSQSDISLLENRGKVEEDEVYEISSGDDDCSRGMKKWITEYHLARPGAKILQQKIDDFIVTHEAQEEQARKEREAQAAEGGWTVVAHHKGRKKTKDSETGITVGSVAQAAVMDKMSKKRNKEVVLDVYGFQKREAKRNEIMMLQSKFEQDKKRIQQMRAARKFRPY